MIWSIDYNALLDLLYDVWSCFAYPSHFFGSFGFRLERLCGVICVTNPFNIRTNFYIVISLKWISSFTVNHSLMQPNQILFGSFAYIVNSNWFRIDTFISIIRLEYLSIFFEGKSALNSSFITNLLTLLPYVSKVLWEENSCTCSIGQGLSQFV